MPFPIIALVRARLGSHPPPLTLNLTFCGFLRPDREAVIGLSVQLIMISFDFKLLQVAE